MLSIISALRRRKGTLRCRAAGETRGGRPFCAQLLRPQVTDAERWISSLEDRVARDKVKWKRNLQSAQDGRRTRQAVRLALHLEIG